MIISLKFLSLKREPAIMSSYLFSLILETPAEYAFKNNQRINGFQPTFQTFDRAVDIMKFKESFSDHRRMITPFNRRQTLLSWLIS